MKLLVRIVTFVCITGSVVNLVAMQDKEFITVRIERDSCLKDTLSINAKTTVFDVKKILAESYYHPIIKRYPAHLALFPFKEKLGLVLGSASELYDDNNIQYIMSREKTNVFVAFEKRKSQGQINGRLV